MTERFTLLSELGRGGMGVVWKARDEETGQVVALKVMREIYAEDADYVARFERELELAKRIDSVHVVKVLGYGVRQGRPYLALEYVDGPSLHEALTRHGPYNWPEARELLAQLAQGLADAHAAGVIHRDVKPSNILLARDGTAKLTDFGIARGLDTTRMTATSTMIGTPAYLAPEGPKDARSDLYSLGIIGYELLTGAPPFVGQTYQEVLLAHLRDAPDLARLPEVTRPVIGWLLAKDPAQRPRNAWEVIPVVEERLFLTPQTARTASEAPVPTRPGTPSPEEWAPAPLPEAARGSVGRSGSPPRTGQTPPAIGVAPRSQLATRSKRPPWALLTQAITGADKRAWHTATVLPDRRVLLAGGRDGYSALSAAELFNVAGILAHARPMKALRSEHAAVCLANGQVLVCGGNGEGVLASAELYDSRLDMFLETGTMTNRRRRHTATLLLDGRVLIAGGWNGESELASTELYDSGRGRFHRASDMSGPRENHTATLLRDGRVLLVGGYDKGYPNDTAEIWDAAGGSLSRVRMRSARVGHTATLLRDGTVLVVGGRATERLSSVDCVDPHTGAFQSASTMRVARERHTATLTTDGFVLVVGGVSDTGPLASVEAYDPATCAFTDVGRIKTARVDHTATLLADGRILVAGGQGQNGFPLDSIELLTLERRS
jgi:serine/threonine protein kinase